MAIARDSSSPAEFDLTYLVSSDDAGPATSAAFTPPVDSWITISIGCDAATGITPTATLSNTGFTCSPAINSSLVISRGDSEGEPGIVYIYRTKITASASGTVTVTVNNIGLGGASDGTARGRVMIDVWTGAKDDQTGAATGENSFTTNTFTGTLLTTTADNSQVIAMYEDWNASGVPTTSQQGTGFDNDGIDGIRTYQTTPTTAGDVAGSFDGFGTGATASNWAAIELLAAPEGIHNKLAWIKA